MAVKIQLWWYEHIVHQALERFADGNYKLQPFGETIKDFFSSRIAEEEWNGNKYDASYGKHMIWGFVSLVVPLLTDDTSSIQEIGESLREGIRFLEEALLSKFGETDKDSDIITSELKNLKSQTVLLAIVKFLNDKSESRIIYNRYKDCLSRYQKESIKCVLQDILDPKKILMPYAKYLKLIEDVVRKVITISSQTLISKMAQSCYKRAKDRGDYGELIDDVDGVSNKATDQDSLKTASSFKGSSHVKGVNGIQETRTVNGSNSSVDVIGSSSSPKRSKLLVKPKKRAADRPKIFMNSSRLTTPATQSLKDGGLLKDPLPGLKSSYRPAESYSGRKRAESVTSSKMTYRSWQKHPFTPLQDAYIIMGMKTFGTNKREWKKILSKYPFPEYRTGVHLKDRWRTLLKHGQVKVDGGEITLSEKYHSLINYLSNKKLSEHNRKKYRAPVVKQKAQEHDTPQTPDLEYLTPEDLSDLGDKEPTILPGLEHVRRWIKTGSSVTDRKPPSRIPALLIAKNSKPKQMSYEPDAMTKTDKGTGISESFDSSHNCKSNDKHEDQNRKSDAALTKAQPTLSNKEDQRGENVDHTPISSPSEVGPSKQSCVVGKEANLDSVSKSEMTTLPRNLSTELTTSCKEYEYEKNSNGKYVRKTRKTENKSDSRKLHTSDKDVESDLNQEHHSEDYENPVQMTDITEAIEPVGEESESDEPCDKTLLPPEDTGDDIDLIREMENDECTEKQQSKCQQGTSQSTLGLLEEFGVEVESQTQTQSSPCTEKSFANAPEIDQKSPTDSQNSAEKIQQMSPSDDRPELAEYLSASLYQSVIQSDRELDDVPKLSNSIASVGSQVQSQATVELAANLENHLSQDIVPETAAEQRAESDNAASNSPQPRNDDSNSQLSERASELHLEGGTDDDSAMLIVDEGLSDEDDNKTLVQTVPENANKSERPHTDHTSDGGYNTAVEVEHKNENQDHNTVSTVNQSVGLSNQQRESVDCESPCLSTQSLNLDPRSPISEYYTASEGSQSGNEKDTPQSSDSEESEEINSTIVQNTTIKDAEIPNNVEQWIAENPQSSEGPSQEDTLDLLSRLGKEANSKSSLGNSPEGSEVSDSQTKVKKEIHIVVVEEIQTNSSENAVESHACLEGGNKPPPELDLDDDVESRRHIKREYMDSEDLLRPPNESDIKGLDLFLTGRTPILSLPRIKIEPGVFTTDACLYISSDDDGVQGETDITEVTGQDKSDVASELPSTSGSVLSSNEEKAGDHGNHRALDLTADKKKHTAKKSTGGVVKKSKKKVISEALMAKKMFMGSQKKLPVTSEALSVLNTNITERKSARTKKKKSSSKSSGSFSDSTNSSGSFVATKSSTNTLKKSVRDSRKRKILLHDDGVPLKLSRDDELLFDSKPTGKNASAFETYGKQKQGKRKAWSQEEDDNLMSGVRKFGEGKWKSILDQYQFRNRTVVNLKDRYRILKEN